VLESGLHDSVQRGREEADEMEIFKNKISASAELDVIKLRFVISFIRCGIIASILPLEVVEALDAVRQAVDVVARCRTARRGCP
jgi:hypothetical protein